MPFDEEEEELPSKKSGLKKVSSQKSIFENLPKKPSHEEFEKKVQASQERSSNYKIQGAALSKQFLELLNNKTLKQNKNVFMQDTEKELLSKMIQLAIDINNDPMEQEGMGSLSWITLLLKICLMQRDKINQLEYAIDLLDKRTDPSKLKNAIFQELKNLEEKNT